MSSEQPYESPSGLEPKKSNTVLIVVIVLVVLTISALCVCGGVAGFLFWTLRVESNQRELPVELVPMEPPPPSKLFHQSNLHLATNLCRHHTTVCPRRQNGSMRAEQLRQLPTLMVMTPREPRKWGTWRTRHSRRNSPS